MNIINSYRFAAAGTGYIVDDYSPEAAWSLREIASAYVGVDIVEVERSSDSATSYFTATEITDGTLTTWVGAGNDGRVITLVDQTGGGNDLVENVLTTAPRIVISGSLVTDGGLPAMDYAGASENSVVLRTAATNSWLAGSDFSVFCVANSDVASRTHYVWTNDVASTGKKRGLFAQATDELRFIFWSSPAQEVLGNWSSGSQSVVSLVCTGMLTGETYSIDTWIDGSAQANNSGTGQLTPPSEQFVLGNAGQGTSTFDFDGKIAECIVFASDQTSNRSAIDSNIMSHYGIT